MDLLPKGTRVSLIFMYCVLDEGGNCKYSGPTSFQLGFFCTNKDTGTNHWDKISSCPNNVGIYVAFCSVYETKGGREREVLGRFGCPNQSHEVLLNFMLLMAETIGVIFIFDTSSKVRFPNRQLQQCLFQIYWVSSSMVHRSTNLYRLHKLYRHSLWESNNVVKVLSGNT